MSAVTTNRNNIAVVSLFIDTIDILFITPKGLNITPWKKLYKNWITIFVCKIVRIFYRKQNHTLKPVQQSDYSCYKWQNSRNAKRPVFFYQSHKKNAILPTFNHLPKYNSKPHIFCIDCYLSYLSVTTLHINTVMFITSYKSKFINNRVLCDENHVHK